MRESFDQWQFVIAAIVLGVGASVALVGLSWRAMRQAEARRDAAKGTHNKGDISK